MQQLNLRTMIWELLIFYTKYIISFFQVVSLTIQLVL